MSLIRFLPAYIRGEIKFYYYNGSTEILATAVNYYNGSEIAATEFERVP